MAARRVKSEVYTFIVTEGGTVEDAVARAWGGERSVTLTRATVEGWVAKWQAKDRLHVDFAAEAAALGHKLLRLRREVRPLDRRWPAARNAAVCRAVEEITGRQRRTWQRARRATHEPQIEAIAALLLEGRAAAAAGGGGGGVGDSTAAAVDEEEVLIELGGGKGLLSRVVAHIDANTTVVTVDRRAPSIAATFADHDGAADAVVDVPAGVAAAATDAAAPGAESAGDARVTRVVQDIRDVRLASIARRLGQPAARRLAVTGKHLCGDASDWAVQCCTAEDGSAAALRTVVLVPCCHPQLSDALTAPFMGGLLAQLTLVERRLLCRLIEDAKLLRAQGAGSARKQAAGGGGAVKRWGTLISTLGDAANDADLDVRDLTARWARQRARLLGFGRVARRVVEEDRMRALEARGFACTLVEITPTALTPDNLAIVARRDDGTSGGPSSQLPLASTATATARPELVTRGIVLLLSTRTHSALTRAAEFFLELRDAALIAAAAAAASSRNDDAQDAEHALGEEVETVWVDNALGALIVVGEPARLRSALAAKQSAAAIVLAPPMLQQSLAFTAFAPTLEAIVEGAIAAGSAHFPLRVRALPRSLERTIARLICDGSCASEPCVHLSTSAPAALLEVILLGDAALGGSVAKSDAAAGAVSADARDGARAFAWALTPVAAKVQAAAASTESGAHGARSAHHQLERRLAESAMRTIWVGDGGGSIGPSLAAAACAAFAGVCLVVADTSDREEAMAAWARAAFPRLTHLVRGECGKALSAEDTGDVEVAGCAANLVLCDAGRDFRDSIDLFVRLADAGCIADGARVWATMRQKQRKGAAAQSRRDAALLRELGSRLGSAIIGSAPDVTKSTRFSCFEAHHQLSDRAWERSVHMCFGGSGSGGADGSRGCGCGCVHTKSSIVAV
jgi:hypothetical protein